MDRNEALAVAFANLKGPRDKDLMGTARALQFLKDELGSNAKVGAELDVSGEMVREFLCLLRLPPDVQTLLDERQLSLEKGRRLWLLSRRRPTIVSEAAQAMTDMSVLDARHFLEYLRNHPDQPVEEAKRQVLETKTVTEPQFHVVAALSKHSYVLLSLEAHKSKTTVNDLVTRVIQDWLNSEHDDA